MESNETQASENIAVIIARWVFFLPAAILGGIVGGLLARLIGFLGSSRYGDDSWWSYIVNEFLANGAFGAAFVYAGCFVAPKYRPRVGIVLAGIALFISGYSFFVYVGERAWMGILGVVAMNIGSMWVAYSTYTEDIDY